jgi:hypothetical protein
MPEQNKPFVVTDRRKFTLDGQPRPAPDPVAAVPEPAAPPPSEDLNVPPALTDEQIRQAKLAYDQTADRLETAIRAANPGMERIPEMTFDRLVQSVYMTAIVQLGGSAQESDQPRVDLMGARQSIEMLAVLEAKTIGNVSGPEKRLLEDALFELRMAFLEVTQALARSTAPKTSPLPPPPGGRPTIVR